MAVEIHMYSTQGCHLCDDASSIIKPFKASFNFSLNHIDIAECDELFKRYGTSIPVVVISGQPDKSELFWPFNAEGFCDWFIQHATE